MSLIKCLRVVSLTEGVSYLLLLGVAMPMKYLMGMPVVVQWVGWAHGLLFVLLWALTFLAVVVGRLPLRLACLVGVASLLPAGPFFMERPLRAHEVGKGG